MARTAQDPKAKKKKNVSPVTTAVVIVVVLALVAVVYLTFGKEKQGLDENDPQIKQLRLEQKKAGGVKGIKARMEWLRSGRKGRLKRTPGTEREAPPD